MSFTTDIKKEIISRGVYDEEQAKAALSAFIHTSGNVGVIHGEPSFFIVSETENVAEFFMQVFSETFGFDLSITSVTRDRMSGRGKLLLQCAETRAKEVLSALGFIKRNGELREGIAAARLADEEREIAYIQGAFLGGGSCTLPNESGKTGYHLEIVFPEKQTAKAFCKILQEFELIAKVTERKETYVVYLKSKEVISDFLAVIGADNSLRKFSQLVEKRDEANHNNRTQNCMAGNADKAATASAKQVIAIQRLMKSNTASEIHEDLLLTAKTRLENPLKSMQELADYMKISKSCLNHRMRKLMELANKLDEQENKE